MAQTHHRDSGNELTINNTTDEDGFLKIYGKNADALILGDATHEGGDISVYRNASGNKQLFVDADAASNAIGMSVYGGVVVQNYLTVGQSTLDTTRPFLVSGIAQIDAIYTKSNQPNLFLNCNVTSGTATHSTRLQIHGESLIAVQAVGNGSGGIDAATKAIGLYGTIPATQHAAIADATDAATAITQLNLALAALRAIGLIAT